MNFRFACILLLLAGCGSTERPSTELLEKGRAVYNFRCYFCHGYSGNAKTLAATYMNPTPRDFTAATAQDLPLSAIRSAVVNGRPGTGMKSFSTVIDADEIEAVSVFVFDEFVVRKAPNTRYHTVENGWPDHEKYKEAFPFARGEISLTANWESLTPDQQKGRKLFVGACISCHDRGKPTDDPIVWESRAISWPRHNYDHKNPDVDAETSATPYRLHDIVPLLDNPTPSEKKGEKLFQDNCAFCHGADGTGKNWIGSFLEPHPRDLTSATFMSKINRVTLRNIIREGVKESSMPAWKSVLSDEEIDLIVSYINKAFTPVPK